MRFIATDFPGLYVIEPKIFRDARGFFYENYSSRVFAEHGLHFEFIQDNHARSEDVHVLRGLHFQIPPAAQAKLVRVVRGAVFDVAVDLRRRSPTFGQWFGLELSEENFKQLLIPQGFAHGYVSLKPGTEFLYKVDALYSPSLERGLRYDDPTIDIQWPVTDPILSMKDQNLSSFAEFESPFVFENSQ